MDFYSKIEGKFGNLPLNKNFAFLIKMYFDKMDVKCQGKKNVFFPLCFDFIDLKGEKRNYSKINKFSNQTAKADMHVGTFIKLVPCTSCCQCLMVNLSLTFGIRKFGNVDRKGWISITQWVWPTPNRMIMRGEECGVTLVSVGFTWSRPLHVNALATN